MKLPGFGSPEELAGLGHVGDGHCGAEAPCPRCAATDRTAETDFYGGVRLRCVKCRHVEPVTRRPPPPETRAPVVPDVYAHLTLEVQEDIAPRRALMTQWTEAIPSHWVEQSALAEVWAVSARTARYRVRQLRMAGLVDARDAAALTGRARVVQVRRGAP